MPKKKYLTALVIAKTGKTIKQLVVEELRVEYATFNYRARQGHIHVSDYLHISLRTGISLDVLITGDPDYADIIQAVNKSARKFGLIGEEIPIPGANASETIVPSDGILSQIIHDPAPKIKEEDPEPIQSESPPIEYIGNEPVY